MHLTTVIQLKLNQIKLNWRRLKEAVKEVLTCAGLCSLCPVGAAAATDSNRQVVPEEAHWDAGAGAAGVELSHTGERENAHRYGLQMCDNPRRAACCSQCYPCLPQVVLFSELTQRLGREVKRLETETSPVDLALLKPCELSNFFQR